ncbi:hypothetical protein M422DRAFT_240071 [Sphaerobolus stellatus SS14]|nr:hypothetical protein M422DRAFT_240071 [Sphaerobolus stellatus SS14]
MSPREKCGKPVTTGSTKDKLISELKLAKEKLVKKKKQSGKEKKQKVSEVEAATDGEEGENSSGATTTTINWSDKHDLTWSMLLLIQASPVWLQAFSFDAGGENVNSSGKKPAALYRELAPVYASEASFSNSLNS